jgi:hypothetical protein
MAAPLSQPGILASCLPVGRSLAYRIATGADPRPALARLARGFDVDHGVTDALFRFSGPVTGGYDCCPPIADGRLDLRLLKL